jgi:hypothetical protein
MVIRGIAIGVRDAATVGHTLVMYEPIRNKYPFCTSPFSTPNFHGPGRLRSGVTACAKDMGNSTKLKTRFSILVP